MFGKIKNGTFMAVPVNYITDEGVTISNFTSLSETDWRGYGFKPVIESPPPVGGLYAPHYRDDIENIVIDGWVKAPSKPDLAELDTVVRTILGEAVE